MNILFSIIVPVFNVEKYLEECVQSILNQTFQNYELILVDDGSSDFSAEICDMFLLKNPEIKVIHQKNSGLSQARNTGIKCALGDYIIFLDSDDYWKSSDYLMKLKYCILINTSPDIIINTAYIRYLEKTKKSKLIASVINLEEVNKLDYSEAINKLIKSNYFPVSACFKIVKRTIINDVYFVPNLLSEDIDWSISVIQRCQTLFLLNEPCYVYRMRENSITHSIKEKTYSDLYNIIAKWSNKLKNEENKLNLSLLGLLTYEFYILIGIRQLLGNFDEYRKDIEKLKWLTKYSFNKKTVLCTCLINLIGIKKTAFFLAKYIGR